MTAAPGSIGVVRSTGDFRVDGSTVRGNSTVFDGNLIETTTARSVVQLNSVQITLAPESRAKVYQDRTVLEKGAGLLRNADKHILEAISLQIAPANRDAVIQVDVEGSGRIAVAARSGSALVHNSSGVLLADLRAGTALEFEPQAAASTVVKISGEVDLRNGNYFLTDATTGVISQLRGDQLGQYVGKKVEIVGSQIPGAKPVGGATQVVQVGSVSLAAAAGAAGTAGAGAAAVAAGSHVAVIAIIGGVTIGGTLIGLEAAGTFSGGSPTSAK
ncbi:MAG: hypothetical protein ABSH56_33860 [Bryobacteraceae bacterium]|jgi:hypothetical protein